MSDNTKGDGTDNSDNEEHRESSPHRSSPIYVPSNEHKLQYPYWLWFRRPGNRLRSNTVQYEQALKLVGQFASVEQWWALYSHLVRPSELPPDTSFNLFKYGVRPMWEDAANINGGKWVIRLRKGLAARAWEDLCMAMLGEQFMVGPEICGIVISIKFQEDIISVWHRTASDQGASARIRDTLRRVLHLQPGVSLEYKIHTQCLKASTMSVNSSGGGSSNYYPTTFHSSSNTARVNSYTTEAHMNNMTNNAISNTNSTEIVNSSNADLTSAESPTTNSSTPDTTIGLSNRNSSTAGSSTPESTNGSLSTETTSTMSSDSTTQRENEGS